MRRSLAIPTGVALLLGLGAAIMGFEGSGALAQTAATKPAPKVAKRLLLEVPLIIDRRARGDVPVAIDRRGVLEGVDGKALLKILAPIVRPDLLQKIRQSFDANGLLTLQSLQRAGFQVAFNEIDVVLEMDVPGASRRLSRIGFRGRRPHIKPGSLAPPAEFSSQLSLRGGVDYVHETEFAVDEGRQPINLNFDWAANYQGTVLETDVAYDE